MGRLCRAALERLDARGLLEPGTDIELETARLHSLFESVALHSVADPDRMTEEVIRKIFDHQLTRLTGQPGQPGGDGGIGG